MAQLTVVYAVNLYDPALQKAIEGYQLFIKLAEQYVEEAIRLTRRERKTKKLRREPKP